VDVGWALLAASVAFAFADTAELVELESEGTSCALVVSCVPSSWPENHVGRTTPDSLLYMKVWLMLAVLLALAALGLKYGCIVIGSAYDGFGLKVMQYVSELTNKGMHSTTGVSSPASEEVGSLDVELRPGALLRYTCVLFVSDALRTYVPFMLLRKREAIKRLLSEESVELLSTWLCFKLVVARTIIDRCGSHTVMPIVPGTPSSVVRLCGEAPAWPTLHRGAPRLEWGRM
jgi:hypothetical protein